MRLFLYNSILSLQTLQKSEFNEKKNIPIEKSLEKINKARALSAFNECTFHQRILYIEWKWSNRLIILEEL